MYPNWFTAYADLYFSRFLTPLAGQAGLRFLQIGAFTGDTSVWLCKHVLTGPDCTLVDVDTWQGSPEHDFDWRDVERVYDEQTAGLPILKVKSSSSGFFDTSTMQFDFIYIDGSHTAPDVLEDGIAALSAVRPLGLIAFDDYLWHAKDGKDTSRPGPAIDALLAVYADRLAALVVDAQVWVRVNG